MALIRLLIDHPQDGAWNMAVDESILHFASEKKLATLRFYQWKKPTVSLGYFQKSDDLNDFQMLSDVDLVRRMTGGGAIVHHHELTYSFVTPITDRLHHNNYALYQKFHQGLIEVLNQWDILAHLYDNPHSDEKGLSKAEPKRAEPFLCFERRSEGDLIIGQKKVTGSAQRRHKNAILQHGSILLETSPLTKHLTAINELQPNHVEQEKLLSLFLQKLSDSLGGEFQQGELTEKEIDLAHQIKKERYDNPSWTYKR
ncbi:MAG: lipoate--protein ligase family protein [Pirellulaceae bacterium]|nr:lipoate--protein ligase family protein [Pirellulaceae bacterium]